MSKFYRTKEFFELSQTWQEKLKESGFEDIETLERYYYYSDTRECPLAEVEGLALNTDYDVHVRGRYRNIWGGYGALFHNHLLFSRIIRILINENAPLLTIFVGSPPSK